MEKDEGGLAAASLPLSLPPSRPAKRGGEQHERANQRAWMTGPASQSRHRAKGSEWPPWFLRLMARGFLEMSEPRVARGRACVRGSATVGVECGSARAAGVCE